MTNTMFEPLRTEAAGEDRGFGDVNPFYITFVAFGIILPVMAAIGVVFNTFTAIILWRRELRSRTVHFLRALAMFDTALLVMAVVFLTPLSWAYYLKWDSLRTYLKQVYPFMVTPCQYVFSTVHLANVWITVAIAVERFITLCFPFKSASMITERSCIKTVIAIIVASAIYNIPYILVFRVVECPQRPPTNNVTSKATQYTRIFLMQLSMFPKIIYDNSHAATTPCYSYEVTAFARTKFFYYFSTYLYGIMFTFLPLFFIMTSTIFTIKELRKMMSKRSYHGREEREESNYTIVLIMIIVMFLLCSITPVISQFKPFGEGTYNDMILLSVANLSVTLNSTVNFFIYSTFGRKFRKSVVFVIRKVSIATSISMPKPIQGTSSLNVMPSQVMQSYTDASELRTGLYETSDIEETCV